jgi:hypothetical protein
MPATKTRPRSKGKFDREEARAKADDKRVKVDQLIEDGLAMLTNPDHWRRYLTCATANEGRRSFRNQLLILMQRPDATDCEGFGEWLKRGRVVRKGETGLLVFAPVTRNVPVDGNGKELKREAQEGDIMARKMGGLRIASVFDISQTEPLEGKEQKPAKGAKPVDADSIRDTIADIGGEHAEAILAALDEALDDDDQDDDDQDDDDQDDDDE